MDVTRDSTNTVELIDGVAIISVNRNKQAWVEINILLTD